MTPSEAFAAGLLLCAVGYAAIDATAVGAAPADDAGAAPARARPPRMVRRDADAGQAIVSRALFLPSRRGDVAGGNEGRGTIGGYVLRGTVSGVAGQFAIFEPQDGGPARRLRVGNVIGGYSLASIEAESVVLTGGGEHRRVDIGDRSVPVPPGVQGTAEARPTAGSRAAAPPPAAMEVLPVIVTTDAQGR